MIERQHLAILREVERRGSLTSAAECLCLTQPALSHAIKKLERQVGTVLWKKDGRGLRLTPAGQHLLAVAQRLLPQLEHAERVLRQIARGERGTLRIGMECHPCYRWLLRVVSPYLEECPNVDVDVKQQFQFGGIGALFGHEIDVLITPDPLKRPGLKFEAVYPYEQVLVVAANHRLAEKHHVEPEDLLDEVLFSYPVAAERLDVYTQFLTPANCSPRRHQTIEATDIMIQMVAAGRGVTALPRWLVAEYPDSLLLRPLRLGKKGLQKHIFVGVRRNDAKLDYVESFLRLARQSAQESAIATR